MWDQASQQRLADARDRYDRLLRAACQRGCRRIADADVRLGCGPFTYSRAHEWGNEDAKRELRRAQAFNGKVADRKRRELRRFMYPARNQCAFDIQGCKCRTRPIIS